MSFTRRCLQGWTEQTRSAQVTAGFILKSNREKGNKDAHLEFTTSIATYQLTSSQYLAKALWALDPTFTKINRNKKKNITAEEQNLAAESKFVNEHNIKHHRT